MSRSLSLGIVLTLTQLLACGGSEEKCTQLLVTTYPDVDGDGYGGEADAQQTCGTPVGRTQSPGDCDDTRSSVNIGGLEVCDAIDNDCDGEIDDGLVASSWYLDSDGDGYGAGAVTTEACAIPDGYSATSDDCDDTVAGTHPGANEVCDGADNDCDGDIDQDDETLDQSSTFTFYADTDGDAFGDPNVFTEACVASGNMVDNSDDCDDSRPSVNPLAVEVCDRLVPLDNDCDGLIDEADPSLDSAQLTTYYADNDGDGYGDFFAPLDRCFQPADSSVTSDDCDDSNPLLGLPSDWYEDLDGDGYGSGVAIEFAQCVPTDLTLVPDGGGLDCDDGDAARYPSAVEICGDSIDSNCNGNDCNDFSEDFETGALDPYWVTAGNASWLIASSNPYEGSYYAKCGNISDNQLSSMRVTLDFIDPGVVSFWHSGSTENNFDFLKVFVDGVQVMSRSGTWAWTYQEVGVGAGLHTIKFEYDKDGSVSVGDDTVYIDLIQATNAVIQ
ncbi:MAG: hypothetical protein GWP91_13195 [Rhodobacterales bacterium]|nr:hypothetical protein [Rhodobacterales bacterium]